MAKFAESAPWNFRDAGRIPSVYFRPSQRHDLLKPTSQRFSTRFVVYNVSCRIKIPLMGIGSLLRRVIDEQDASEIKRTRGMLEANG